MTRHRGIHFLTLRVAFFALLAAGVVDRVQGQPAWRPDKPIELIMPTAAGGANDNVARFIQKILQDHKLVPTPVVVMNKAGGNQTLAAVDLRQNARDPHHCSFPRHRCHGADTGIVQQSTRPRPDRPAAHGVQRDIGQRKLPINRCRISREAQGGPAVAFLRAGEPRGIQPHRPVAGGKVGRR